MVKKAPDADFFEEPVSVAAPTQAARHPKAPTHASPPAAFALYATVALNQPVEQLFTYGVPAELDPQPLTGSIVSVPFGGQKARGCVVRLDATPPAGVAPSRVRPVHGVLCPEFQLPPNLISLGLWMSAYYMCSPGEALSCISFIGFNDIQEKTVIKYALAPGFEAKASSLTAKQRTVVAHLEANPESFFSAEEIQNATGAGVAVVKKLLEHAVIARHELGESRHDEYDQRPRRSGPLELNPSQHIALERICQALRDEKPRDFLLYGVTSSGKTEVYLQAIEQALQNGGSAVMLVPEISLTPQTVSRVRSRFGDLVGVYHSRLTLGQKYDLWRRVRSGECRIMVGARSALFTPFEKLRLIIVDEEHETSYKQDSAPRYHARTMAIKRMRSEGGVVVLGSATPSIECFFQAQQGKIELLSLPERIDQRPFPEVRIINMTQETKEAHNSDLFSNALRQQMQATLERGEQSLLLLNRRGFFNFMVCMDCNAVARCEHCDVSLTHHKPLNKLLCHYCNRVYELRKTCPECGSDSLSLVGVGTQRVEEHVHELLPEARVLRMDLDTTRRRTAFLEAWQKIERGDVDVILGTQMIAKGIHLENVTLVAVPLADVSLFQPDFRSAERAFSLLTQVAGRAGRGDKPGQVILQTYVPQHYAIHFAQNHDYRGFYDKEIRVRKILRFPPFYRLVSVLALGEDEKRTAELMKEFARCLRSAAFVTQGAVVVLGPAPAPISRISDCYRWRLIMRGTDHQLMKNVLRKAREAFSKLSGHSAIQLVIDVDPQDLL